MTHIEYEVLGYNDDDAEWCAATDSQDESYHYAMVYSNDYEKVEVYEVTKKLVCEISKKGKKVKTYDN